MCTQQGIFDEYPKHASKLLEKLVKCVPIYTNFKGTHTKKKKKK